MALPKNPLLKKILLIFIVILLATAAVYLFITDDSRKASFLISSTEINTVNDGYEEATIRAGGTVYFWFSRKKTYLDTGTVSLTIIPMDSADNMTYDITYGISKDFPSLSSAIPGQYFAIPGRYKIKGFLDKNEISIRDVTVTGPE